jgi:hypothetical protein
MPTLILFKSRQMGFTQIGMEEVINSNKNKLKSLKLMPPMELSNFS